MRRPRRLVALAASLVLLLGTAACSGGQADAKPGALTGVSHKPYVVDPIALTDTDGQPFSLTKDTTKPLTLVFFGYLHCPDICPLVMSTLASALTRLDPADRKQVDVVFVTSDPTRDTPKALRAYLDRYDPTFIGLTGDLASIVALGKTLAVYVDEGQKLPSGGYDPGSHSTQVSAITADDTSPLLWTQDTSSAQYAADIHTLLQRADS